MAAATPLAKSGPARLKRWRERLGLDSYASAAEVLCIPWHRYRRWELGVCVPSVDGLILLKEKCAIPVVAWGK